MRRRVFFKNGYSNANANDSQHHYGISSTICLLAAMGLRFYKNNPA